MKVNIGGTLKPVTSAKINIGGTLKLMSRVKHNVAGTLKDGASFYVALTATGSTDSVSGHSFGGTVTTSTVTITPAGGYAPYTYAWVRLSGDGAANSSTSATTTFSAAPDDGDSLTGSFRCTVTDSHGATSTVDCAAIFNNFGPLGP